MFGGRGTYYAGFSRTLCFRRKQCKEHIAERNTWCSCLKNQPCTAYAPLSQPTPAHRSSLVKRMLCEKVGMCRHSCCIITTSHNPSVWSSVPLRYDMYYLCYTLLPISNASFVLIVHIKKARTWSFSWLVFLAGDDCSARVLGRCVEYSRVL